MTIPEKRRVGGKVLILADRPRQCPHRRAETVAHRLQGLPRLAPGGKHLLCYDGKNWSTISIPDGKMTNLSGKLKVKFFDEEDDHPQDPPPYGSLGWSTDGKFVLLYDRYDLWKLAADGSSAMNLTKIGREKGFRFRYVRLRDESDDDPGIDLAKPMLLSVENLQTRDTGFFRLEPAPAKN